MSRELIQTRKNSAFPMDIVRWWEKKRLLYNLFVVLLTTVIIWSLWEHTGPFISKKALIYHAFWLIVCSNVLYTGGWAGGILRRYYLKAYPFSNTGRWILFIAGTFFASFIMEIRLSILVNPMFFVG